ncbi:MULTISPECIES: hypothetical protein [unclassified Arthrobacter]|uniref:hypothetical protein n=1 Tax=unclassified Arthrobacter TaxID=235627 RepID=UPI0014909921|nr:MULTISPECIES: hypothetical protein [unclassified Arthrobacter]NOJ59366.1 hypothetical protein [Arthrobacter sp. 260]NOJ62142.1 hypothetical protein [Arthrobacter sp. 147(2020)]
MSEQANEGQIVTPNDGGGATSDENYRGDAGDQANDLRFSEEQQLINSQAKGEFPDSDTENLEPVPGGGYTGAQKRGATDSGFTGEQDPAKEGEYTDIEEDPADGTGPEGEYTDADSVPSIQEGGDPSNEEGSR